MKLTTFSFGLVVGLLLMALAGWLAMPPMMVSTHKSPLAFDATVNAVEKAVAAQPGWKVVQVFDIQANIVGAGYTDMTRVKVVAMCQPHYARRILSEDGDKMVSTMMPLGIGIYETRDGSVHMAEMNVGLMGMMFGGNIATVMTEASADIGAMMADVTGSP